MLRRGPCGLGDPGERCPLRGARDSEAEGGAAGGGHAAERMGRPGCRCLGVPSHPHPPPRGAGRAGRGGGVGVDGKERWPRVPPAGREGWGCAGRGLCALEPGTWGTRCGRRETPLSPAMPGPTRLLPPPPKSCRQGGSRRGPALRLHTLPRRRMCKRMGGWRRGRCGGARGGAQEKPARSGLLRG